MKRNVIIPGHVKRGIRHLRSGFPERVRTFGFDTETVHGEPYTLQIHDGTKTHLWYVNKNNVLRIFAKFFAENATPGHPNVIWGHNLEYDLSVLFYNHLPRFLWDRFKIPLWGWEWDVFCGARYFAFAKMGKLRLSILDTFAFFPTSLARVADTMGVELSKLPKPRGLGTRRLTGKAWEEYAKRDALLAHRIGMRILDFEKDVDCPVSVTGPQLSSRIFRKRFLRPDDTIDFPGKMAERAARLSYHGGKNGLYVPGNRWYDCTEIDISSAYPYAMSLLPGFLRGRYVYVRKYVPHVPGIYHVTGTLKDCRWPVFLDEDGRKAKPGRFSGWVTGWELVSAGENGEIDVDNVRGWIREDLSTHLPLREYVSTYYKKKFEVARTDPYYSFYKRMLLNSLYGKFIQAIDLNPTLVSGANPVRPRGPVVVQYLQTDTGFVRVEGRKARAGGLYQPFIASQITGHCRAYLHDLEHLYEAIHSATDSVKTCLPVAELPGLGGLQRELSGPCLLIRNKLYLHHDQSMRLKKWALHGYRGTTDDVLLSWNTGIWEYDYEKILKPREAVIHSRRGEALAMVRQSATVAGIGSGMDRNKNQRSTE